MTVTASKRGPYATDAGPKTIRVLLMLARMMDAGPVGVHEDALIVDYCDGDPRKLRRYIRDMDEAGWITAWRGAGIGRRLVLIRARQ